MRVTCPSSPYIFGSRDMANVSTDCMSIAVDSPYPALETADNGDSSCHLIIGQQKGAHQATSVARQALIGRPGSSKVPQYLESGPVG